MNAALPGGFEVGAGEGAVLVVTHGPAYAAAVRPADGEPSNAELWSERIAQDGHVRAVLLDATGATSTPGPEGFQHVHAAAERVADLLGTGAIDVVVGSVVGSVAAGPADRHRLHAAVDAAHAALGTAPASLPLSAHQDAAGFCMAVLEGPVRVVLTDASASAAELHAVLAAGPAAVVLASGASGVAPGADRLASAAARLEPAGAARLTDTAARP